MNLALLIVQTLVLLGLSLRELLKRVERNLVLVLLVVESLVLVQGQSAYMLWDLNRNGEPVRYFSGLIYRDGFTLANLCLTVSVILIAASYLSASAVRRRPPRPRSAGLYQGVGSYIWTMAFVAAAILVIMHLWGGAGAFVVHRTDSKMGGLTVTLIVLLIGSIPLFHRIALDERPRRIDWAIYTVTFLMLMLDSRFLAILALFQLLLLKHYCGRGLRVRGLVVGAIVGFVVLLGWGSLRDYIGYEQTMTISRYYFGTPSGGGFEPLDFFYRHNESGFSGLAGILTVYLRQGINFDFGASNLSLLTHLMPNAIRTSVLSGLDRYLVDVYPYHGSVVPGGYEAAFAHFGFAGLLLLSVTTGTASAWLHRRLLERGGDRLKFAVIAGYAPLLFMGDWWVVALFALGGLAVLYLYRAVTLVAAPARALAESWQT